MPKPKKAARRRGPNVAGDRARDNLLATAISMFARHGYAGVSTRELTTQAGVNQASIYYYFRTKREIYVAAVIRCFSAVSAERLTMLDALEANAGATLEDVLRAFVAPHVRYVTRAEGHDYLRIFATFSATPEEILVELYRDHFGPVRQRFIAAAHRVEPELDDEALHRSFGIVANMIVSALFDHGYRATSGRAPYDVDVDRFIEMLVAYNATGMRALKTLRGTQAPRRNRKPAARRARA